MVFFLDFKFDHHLCAPSDYVYRVNKVLNSHQQFYHLPINKLRICWGLNNQFKTDIDSWINFVHNNRVQHFELDLSPTIRSTKYKLPLETLPPKFGFPYLSVLRLCFVDLTLSYLLSSNNCPLLQHVSLRLALSLKHVKVVGNLMLKSLEFDMCFFMEDIMISSAVNMVSFGFIGRYTTKITFENVPLLTEASFGGPYWMNVAIIPIAPQLLSFLSQLEILRLDFVGQMLHFSIFESSKFPEFKRVKHLEVQANPPCTGCLTPNVLAMIFGCPRLQKFSLKMVFIVESDADSDSDADADSDGEDQDIHYQHQHQCLRAVEFKGCDGNKDELELIAKLLNISVLLEKVTVEFQIQDNTKREGARKAAEKLRTTFVSMFKVASALAWAGHATLIVPH